ncbi:MAG: sigma-70 family RNA polymerase sigma factor [Cyclobacteriaceae bacterium]
MHLVFGICLKYLKNKQDAEDAVIQIFEKLITDLRRHSVENFSSWLYSTSRNFCLMQLRKSGKVKNTLIDDMEYTLSEHQDTEEHVNEDGLHECLDKLPEHQKACVELFYLKQHCYQEITEILNVTLNKVKSAIQNGKRNLKICLESRSENI